MDTSTNTLAKEATRAFFNSDEGYDALKRHWSALVNSPARKTLGPEHHLLYQSLRGKDWRRGFAPIGNEGKLQNGAFYDWGLCHALRRLHADSAQEDLLAPFAALVENGVLDAEALQKVRTVLPRSVRPFEIASAYIASAYIAFAYEVACDE